MTSFSSSQPALWLDQPAVLRLVAPLGYAVPPPADADVPPFVRAASSLCRWNGVHAVVQDDVNALALVDPAFPARAECVLLPRGAGNRRRFESALGNKLDKLDLEAATPLPDGRLLVLGSGSLRARERVVLLDRERGVRLLDASALYEAFAVPEFRGAELNIEGALAVSETLLVFQRGNGARRNGLTAINAVGELSIAQLVAHLDEGAPAPRLERRARYTLGSERGAVHGFTDAALSVEGDVVFLSCAEASPDVIQDGEVLGACFGRLGPRPVLMPIVDERGEPARVKLEGLESRPGDPRRFDVVVDSDDAEVAAWIGVLELPPP